MSVLLCDSNGELWFTRAKELDINYIKMPYTVDKEYLYDLGETVDIHDFYRRVRNGEKATTSALSPLNYVEIIEPFYQEGQDVLYVSFSHALSGTFNHLELALKELKEKYPERKTTVFNTNSISLGAGMQMEQAAILKQKGASDEEILDYLATFTHQIGLYFMVDDLMYLKRGGRLSGFSATVGTMLDLKPILTVSEVGGLCPIKKISGKRKALKYLADKIITDAIDGENFSVYIVDGDCTKDGDFVAELVSTARPELKIIRQVVGPVIGSHCGPNTVGVIFVAESRPIPLIKEDNN